VRALKRRREIAKLANGRPRSSDTINAKTTAKMVHRRAMARKRYHDGKDVDEVGHLMVEGKHREADALQTKALTTKKGKKAWPQLAGTVTKAGMQDKHEGFVRSLSDNASKKHQAGFVFFARAWYSPAEVSRLTNGKVTPQRVRNIKHEFAKGTRKIVPLVHETKTEHTRVRVDVVERTLYTSFFKSNASNVSGDLMKPLRLLYADHQLNTLLYAEYPCHVYATVVGDNDYLAWARAAKRPNKFQKDIMAVCWRREQHDYDAQLEFLDRQKQSKEQYYLKIANVTARERRKRWRATCLPHTAKTKRGPTKPETWKRGDVDCFDPATWIPKPRCAEIFWDIIKNAGIHYTKSWVPHNCPHCEKGPIQQAAYDALTAEMTMNRAELEKLTGQHSMAQLHISKLDDAKTRTDDAKAKKDDGKKKKDAQTKEDTAKEDDWKAKRAGWKTLRKQTTEAMIQLELHHVDMLGHQRELNDDLVNKKLHAKQVKNCRKNLREIEQKLKKGECLIFRDFVNNQTDQMSKIKNLVLVLLWKNVDDGELHVRKISNYCSDKESSSTDAGFVKHVFKFHLDKHASSGEFAGFTKLIIAGDHGSHFSALETILHESTFLERYNMEVRLVFLCSYHAFNRCDRAGQEGVLLAKALEMRRLGPGTAEEFAELVNNSRDDESVAYPFNNIVRLASEQPHQNKKQKKRANKCEKDLRKMCEFEFFATGIFRCRGVPGKGQWTVMDMRHPDSRLAGKELCWGCSKQQETAVYVHENSPCPVQEPSKPLAGSNGPLKIITRPDQMEVQPGYNAILYQFINVESVTVRRY
jgi:hypothetical protein